VIDRELVAKVLDEIPSSRESRSSIESVCQRAGIAEADARSVGAAVICLIAAFGVLSVVHENSRTMIRAVSETGAYFIRSLVWYLRNDQTIFANWERIGAREGPFIGQQTMSGAQFLYLLESRRFEMDEDAEPLRTTSVSQVVVKSIPGKSSEAAYLVQFDDGAQQYQLIGGHQRDSDKDARDTAIREAEEELHDFTFNHQVDQMNRLGVSTVVGLSRTYGVSTHYTISYFQLVTSRMISTGPADRWATHREIETSQLKGGGTLNVDGFRKLYQEQLGGGLDELPLSCPPGNNRSKIVQLAINKPWDSVAIALAIIGIIVSIVLFLLS
jgi:hypothetical protein